MVVVEGIAGLKRLAGNLWFVILTCASVIVLGHLLRQLSIVINPLIWSSGEIISALLSFTIAANVLVRYYGSGNRISLLLGLTFGITGLVHLAAILEFSRAFRQLDGSRTVSLSWMVGQTLLALVFLSAFILDKQISWSREPRRNILTVLTTIVIACSFIFLLYLVLPASQPVNPARFFSRPRELPLAILFLAGAFVLRRSIGATRFAFDSVLIWVAGINAAGHLLASQSVRVLDGADMSAQFANIVGYILLLGATLIDNAKLFGQVQTLAISDSLTGLANYRRLVDILQNEIERSVRTRRPFSVLLMDLDGLKEINDRLGHLAGSRALCRVADSLRLHCRSVDTAARYGGDEFALVLPESTEYAAAQVVERIRQCLEDNREDPRLSLSMGLATFPESGGTVHDLLEVADRALYAMKKQSSVNRAGERERSRPQDY